MGERRHLKLKPSEHSIQTACESYLRFKGFYVQRLNSGMVKATNRFGKERRIRLAAVGTPDLMAFRERDGELSLYFLEIKRPGNKPTFLQEQKMEELEQHGAICFVVHSLEELEEIIPK